MGSRKLDFTKCKSCRQDKKKCIPTQRTWPERCQRCIQKGFNCSPPERIDKYRAASYDPDAEPDIYTILQGNTQNEDMKRAPPESQCRDGHILARRVSGAQSHLPHIPIDEEIQDIIRKESTNRAYEQSSQLVEGIKAALNSRQDPRQIVPYARVSVLLLSWQESDIRLQRSINNLSQVFHDIYGYIVERWRIPSGPERYLEFLARVNLFVETRGGGNNLLIIYYGGYALSQLDCGLLWAPSALPNTASIDSSAIFPLLSATPSDVLLLLDSVQAIPEPFHSETNGIASAIVTAHPSTEVTKPENSPGLFTQCLSRELEILSRSMNVFSDVILHSRLLHYLNNPSDDLQLPLSWEVAAETGIQTESKAILRYPPIYRYLSSNRSMRPIYLGVMPRGVQRAHQPSPNPEPELGVNPQTRQNTETSHPGPEVLISVRLNPDMLDKISVQEWTHWLSSVPSEGQGLEIKSGAEIEPIDATQDSTSYISRPQSINELMLSPSSSSPTDTAANPWVLSDQFVTANGSFSPDIDSQPHEPATSRTADSSTKYTCPYNGCDYVTRGKPENFKSYLRKHMLTHQDPQRFKCSFCEKAFTRPDNLDAHQRRAHPDIPPAKRPRTNAEIMSARNSE
ncbi:hypothetical protein M426DRAFT_89415 [Hypoxylon sp. CI-4A]|nr:hypothetical protein M426DRAFT_89415 [Hypoxylon sp. CI-4A]